jgi:transposase
MKPEELFGLAIGLQKPWYIENIEFKDSEKKEGSKELHIHLSHEKNQRFEVAGHDYPVYDHQDRIWRHLNFFEHVCYLHCKVPRVKTKEGNTLLVNVPWAKAGSSFTLLFEAFSMLLVKGGMSLSGAGKYMKIDGRRIFRTISSNVSEALAEQELEQVTDAGLDETSTRKGHNYITVLTDRKRKKVVGLGLGKNKKAVQTAVNEMESRGSKAQGVQRLTLDLSPSYISASNEIFEDAELVFDRFHIDQLLSKAVDEIRREDQKENVELKKSRYLWLKNEGNLSAEKLERVHYLEMTYPRIGKAYRLKEQFKEIWNNVKIESRIADLEEWLILAWKSDLPPLQKFVNTIYDHWYGIESYFKNIQTNAFAERVNLKIQEIKRIAKGYRNMENFKSIIYFHLGGLDLKLPT